MILAQIIDLYIRFILVQTCCSHPTKKECNKNRLCRHTAPYSEHTPVIGSSSRHLVSIQERHTLSAAPMIWHSERGLHTGAQWGFRSECRSVNHNTERAGEERTGLAWIPWSVFSRLKICFLSFSGFCSILYIYIYNYISIYYYTCLLWCFFYAIFLCTFCTRFYLMTLIIVVWICAVVLGHSASADFLLSLSHDSKAWSNTTIS